MKIILLILTAALFVLPETAEAYIRPGGGSDFIQVLISAVVGIGAFFKSILSKILSIFGKKS